MKQSFNIFCALVGLYLTVNKAQSTQDVSNPVAPLYDALNSAITSNHVQFAIYDSTIAMNVILLHAKIASVELYANNTINYLEEAPEKCKNSTAQAIEQIFTITKPLYKCHGDHISEAYRWLEISRYTNEKLKSIRISYKDLDKATNVLQEANSELTIHTSRINLYFRKILEAVCVKDIKNKLVTYANDAIYKLDTCKKPLQAPLVN